MDMEKLNRENFKSLVDAFSMPGKISTVQPVLDSSLLAIANVLLYNEVTFFYQGKEDISMVKAITNAKETSYMEADYIFSDSINGSFVKEAKKGDHKNPDFSATLIFKCQDFDKTEVEITGPGIDISRHISLPCDKEFINILMKKNSDFPLGVDLFFLNDNDQVLALSRTTKIKAI